MFFVLLCAGLNGGAYADNDSSEAQKVDRNNERKYNTVAYNLYVGLGYNYKTQVSDTPYDDFDMKSNTSLKGSSGSFLFGADFYLGGYFDNNFNTRREYLISPFMGVEIGVPFSKIKNSSDFSWKESFNIVGKIGFVFKLKNDIDMKVYTLFGASKYSVSSFSYNYHNTESFDDVVTTTNTDVFFDGNKGWASIYGAGIDFFYKNRFFAGFEFRYTNFKKLKFKYSEIIEYEYSIASWDGERIYESESEELSFNGDIKRYGYDILIKAGIAF